MVPWAAAWAMWSRYVFVGLFTFLLLLARMWCNYICVRVAMSSTLYFVSSWPLIDWSSWISSLFTLKIVRTGCPWEAHQLFVEDAFPQLKSQVLGHPHTVALWQIHRRKHYIRGKQSFLPSKAGFWSSRRLSALVLSSDIIINVFLSVDNWYFLPPGRGLNPWALFPEA